MSEIHAFEQGGPDLSTEVEMILNFANHLTPTQVRDLLAILKHHIREPDAVVYDADFDMTAEIGLQISAMRAMRSTVIDSNGEIVKNADGKAAVSTRELKEVVTGCSTSIQMLMKYHERLVNFDRMRALERATIKTARTLPEDLQAQFFKTLENELTAVQIEVGHVTASRKPRYDRR